MRDPTFHLRTLEGELLKSDFARDKNLLIPAHRTAVLEEAVATARSGFSTPLRFKTSSLRKKAVYQPTHLSDQLILRLITRNIRRLTGVKQSNRDAIIRSLKAILAEGINYRVYKIDVRNFYETVAVRSLIEKLANDPGFPRDSLRLLRSLFIELEKAGISGLPRGIALSATLSEYAMRTFDETISAQAGVYFYSRFVDDILVLTTGSEDPQEFLQQLRGALFPGLFLNSSKSRYVDYKNPTKGSKGAFAASFDFLGYQFNIHQRQNGKSDGGAYRDVYLDIAPRKVKRIKTRIVKSCLAFLDDGNFDDLHDRLKMLSGNYNLYDQTKHVRRNSGLYCSYRLVHFENSKALPDLDHFLRTLILSPAGVFGGRTPPVLNKDQRRALLKIGFQRGFQSRVFYHFNPSRLSELMGCWAYA